MLVGWRPFFLFLYLMSRVPICLAISTASLDSTLADFCSRIIVGSGIAAAPALSQSAEEFERVLAANTIDGALVDIGARHGLPRWTSLELPPLDVSPEFQCCHGPTYRHLLFTTEHGRTWVQPQRYPIALIYERMAWLRRKLERSGETLARVVVGRQNIEELIRALGGRGGPINRILLPMNAQQGHKPTWWGRPLGWLGFGLLFAGAGDPGKSSIEAITMGMIGAGLFELIRQFCTREENSRYTSEHAGESAALGLVKIMETLYSGKPAPGEFHYFEVGRGEPSEVQVHFVFVPESETLTIAVTSPDESTLESALRGLSPNVQLSNENLEHVNIIRQAFLRTWVKYRLFSALEKGRANRTRMRAFLGSVLHRLCKRRSLTSPPALNQPLCPLELPRPGAASELKSSSEPAPDDLIRHWEEQQSQ